MNPQLSKTIKANISLFPTACCRCENEIEAIMKIARFVQARVWGNAIPNEMAEGGKTHFLSFRMP
jgi:hypothetical protein